MGRARGRPASRRSSAERDMPEACIQRMFDAAANGDVQAYIECFTGPERQRLERQLQNRRPAAFAQTLKDAVTSLRGRAVFANGPIDEAAGTARYTIDRVYESRTERQILELVRQSGTWRIQSVRTTQPFQPETPYGTPVFEE